MKEVIYQLEEGICTLTINREQTMNALNHDVIDDLYQAVDEVERNSENIKGLIITGAGPKSFVAGADISEFVGLSRKEAIALGRKGQALFSEIEKLNIPVIAAVNGFALGGGCELAMACHIRVASTNAFFGQPEVNLGLIPGYGGTQRLVHYIGKGKAIEMLMTGDMIAAEEAYRLGLVNHVVEPGKVLEKSREIIVKISKKAPLAIQKVIKIVNSYFDYEMPGYEGELDSFGNLMVTRDAQEGVDAFLNKRKPDFTGV
ncbi:MAG: enoyl-CoA hydratase/isomerase family protein [Saprospiraceae bacterium]|jgi:enoyl-CoA hydratase|nr:enoyl-CoA hydratase/isomerase family protein [Saprospiraceae bacterium]MBP9210041.1 enoyl-CoA hydratase/isomerase family protein [Saprospiraceae bacterium]MBV6472888.1 Crotonyl-CoA hydratase [Saprospiraceae bacterium]